MGGELKFGPSTLDGRKDEDGVPRGRNATGPLTLAVGVLVQETLQSRKGEGKTPVNRVDFGDSRLGMFFAGRMGGMDRVALGEI